MACSDSNATWFKSVSLNQRTVKFANKQKIEIRESNNDLVYGHDLLANGKVRIIVDGAYLKFSKSAMQPHFEDLEVDFAPNPETGSSLSSADFSVIGPALHFIGSDDLRIGRKVMRHQINLTKCSMYMTKVGSILNLRVCCADPDCSYALNNCVHSEVVVLPEP